MNIKSSVQIKGNALGKNASSKRSVKTPTAKKPEGVDFLDERHVPEVVFSGQTASDLWGNTKVTSTKLSEVSATSGKEFQPGFSLETKAALATYGGLFALAGLVIGDAYNQPGVGVLKGLGLFAIASGVCALENSPVLHWSDKHPDSELADFGNELSNLAIDVGIGAAIGGVVGSHPVAVVGGMAGGLMVGSVKTLFRWSYGG